MGTAINSNESGANRDRARLPKIRMAIP